MGATLRYATVVGLDQVQEHGGLSPSTDPVVHLDGEAPSTARAFVVARGYDGVEGGVEERWRLEDGNGHVVYEGVPRTVLAGDGDVSDEVRGARFEYADDAYQVVVELDGLEAGRGTFAVVSSDPASVTTD